MYLDLHIFHMRDHKDRGGLETGNLRKQFKNSEKFVFIFSNKKTTRNKKQLNFSFNFVKFMILCCNFAMKNVKNR